MLSRETLDAAGYKRNVNPMRRDNWDQFFYQKRFRDERGTRYFIDVYEYDWSILPRNTRTGPRFTYVAKIHFYTHEEDPLAVVEVQRDDAYDSTTALEAFVETIWTKLGAGHYELD
jgi:hypothetical protein